MRRKMTPNEQKIIKLIKNSPTPVRFVHIERVMDFDGTLIYYESPYRLVKSLKQFSEILGDRPAAVARELTKIHEEIKK